MQSDSKSLALSVSLGLSFNVCLPALSYAVCPSQLGASKAEEEKSESKPSIPLATSTDIFAFELFIDSLMSKRISVDDPDGSQPTCGGICAVN